MFVSVNSDSSLAVATWEVTYALIDCCVASLVSESEAKLSSSNIAEPDTPVLITGLVRVLFSRFWEPVRVATVPSIAMSFALAVIPVPPITLTVTAPVVPPPVKPVPAVTSVISPVGTVATWVST